MGVKKTFILDGHKMKTEIEFYNGVQRVLCPSFSKMGRNLDAFNDILRGGFLTFEYGEEITLQFKYRKYAQKHLGRGFIKKIEQIIASNENIEYNISN